MSNTILIKHGSGREVNNDNKISVELPFGALQIYELGYCDTNNLLYIGQPAYEEDGVTMILDEKGKPVPGIPIPVTTPIPELQNMEGILPISKGGTGAATAEEAINNLEITPEKIQAAPSTHNHKASEITSGTISLERIGKISIEKGGTNATTAAEARTNLEITPANIGALALTGGTLTGNLVIKGVTEANTNAFGISNPQITFGNAGNAQRVSLIYTDYNTVFDPASITLIGEQGNEAFIAPYTKTILIATNFGTGAPSGTGKTGQVYFQTVS